MATPKYASPFASRLTLSLDEKKDLCRTAKRLVREMIEDYEEHLWTDHEHLDPSQWAEIREKEDVRVYHDKRPGAGTDDKELNVLLTVGTVLGSLNDAMYGVLNHTTEAMRLKTAYVEDALMNCAVLATIQEPKRDKPFQSVTVKWLVKKVPLAARAISKHRDVVYVEATGIKRLSNGETIGFQLLHAVRFPQTPPLAAYTRVEMSICSIWRQLSKERVQVYMKSYVEVPDRILAPLVVRSTAEALVSPWRYMHCAQMKKLSWSMNRKTPLLEASCKSPHSTTGNNYHRFSIDGGGCCAVCGTQSQSARKGTKSMCSICTRSVCSSCRVKRELCWISSVRQLVQQRVSFCVPCLTVAVRADAGDVARDEVPVDRVPPATLSELIQVMGHAKESFPVTSDRGVSRRSLSTSSSSSASVVTTPPPTTMQAARKASTGCVASSGHTSSGVLERQ